MSISALLSLSRVAWISFLSVRKKRYQIRQERCQLILSGPPNPAFTYHKHVFSKNSFTHVLTCKLIYKISYFQGNYLYFKMQIYDGYIYILNTIHVYIYTLKTSKLSVITYFQIFLCSKKEFVNPGRDSGKKE